ncbi:MAG: phenylalanine--tRNA ligase subunit alpha [Candidatus Saccharimonadales bacterium]
MTLNQSYDHPRIAAVAEQLSYQLQQLKNKHDILKSVELRALFDELKSLSPADRPAFGKQLNQLRKDLEAQVTNPADSSDSLEPIDVSSPFAINSSIATQPALLDTRQGTTHPLMAELESVLNIFYRMGFTASQSRELDDEFHMFTALNFPPGHPARDDYDTFMTIETDGTGNPFVAPAHTSTMQNRLLQKYRNCLDAGLPIAVVVPDRVFRNEDLDARHEHTFYQLEGIYVDVDITAGHLVATIKAFLQDYYQRELHIKIQPFYFPFTEPSFEFAASCPFCEQKGCKICSFTGWIELGGCGMIHPNVLSKANIDSQRFSGFAWGLGIDRLVMLKYNIEDVRHFESGKLEFLRQFL